MGFSLLYRKNTISRYSLPEISNEVYQQLITWVRSHKLEHRLQLRARLILDWINGLSYEVSSQKNAVREATIDKWRKRLSVHLLAGL